MTSSDPAPVEKPAHVHPTRMRHIARADLLAGIGYPGRTIADVRRALADREPVIGLEKVADPATAAEELLDRKVDFLSPAEGRSGLDGLHYLEWMRPLITAYERTADERYAACFARLFDDWYASRDEVVGDWPGLDVVWYSLGVWARATVLAPALTAFADAAGVRDDTAEAMLATLLGGARWAVEEHDAFRPGNWQLVCAAELLHLAAFFPDAPEAAGWAATGNARVVEHLERDFYADGGHLERSPGYHELCLEALQRAAIVARGSLGLRVDEHPRFAAAHDWLAAMTTPGGWVPPWQDSKLVRSEGLLARGAEILGRRSAPETRSRYLAGSGYVVVRGPADGYLGINAGPYVEHELESHSHLAVTDFVLSAQGVPLAIEPGGPATYDDPAYQDWYRHPRAHNLVTVDGRTMSADRKVVVDGTHLDGPVQVVAVHHHGYGVRVTRRVFAVGAEPGYWLFADEVEGGLPATWSVLAPTRWEGTRAGSLEVVAADNELVTSFDEGPGLVPGQGYATLHALRLQSFTGRFDVLLSTTSGLSLETDRNGWTVSGAGFTDTLRAGRWERQGESVSEAVWSLPAAPSCGACS